MHSHELTEHYQPIPPGLRERLTGTDYLLRNLGFVALKKDKAATVNSIHQIPAQGDQLSEYIEVTDIGKRYIELRRRSDMHSE